MPCRKPRTASIIDKLNEPDPVPGTIELPQMSSTIRQVATAHFRSSLSMQKLCLRTERLKAGGAALDNAQIGTARAPHRCRL